MKRHAAISICFLLSWLFVFPVTSPADAQDRFIDNNDGTVTDTLLKVMWAKTDNQGDIDWRQAQQWVKYTFPYTLEKKYDNWRLPTLDELKTLYEPDDFNNGYETDCGQRVKIVPIIELSCGWVWASEIKFIAARLFNFHRGYAYSDRISKKRAYRALSVRNLD
jgi:hypothetical protein